MGGLNFEEFDDEDGGFSMSRKERKMRTKKGGEERKKKREVRERDEEELELKAQAEQATEGRAVPDEAVPEKRAEAVVQPPVEIGVTEIRPELKETTTNRGVVWYDGILEDLKVITSVVEDLSDEEWKQRKGVADKLRHKGVRLPPLSSDGTDRVAFANRQQLQGAIEYLNPLFTGKYKREAMMYLNYIGIGNRTGVECLPGSAEAKEKEKLNMIKPGGEESLRDEEIERKNREKFAQEGLILLCEAKDEEQRNARIEYLEDMGIGIRKFLDDFGKVAPGQSENQMILLRAVVNWWRMTEGEKGRYPGMVKIAGAYASVLGLG